MQKLSNQSKDLSQENIRKIEEIFPNCVTETYDQGGNLVRSIDFDILRQDLSDHVVEGPKERYQFNWPGKREAILLANAPTTNTLRPLPEKSVDFENTKNVYIEGDNLEALKILRETYMGKIKMIYIDPPYNTGNDFVYKDDFKQSTEEYLKSSGNVDEEGNRMEVNGESNGRFHSDWLNMMYPRLILARDLLTDDGAVFISIGDDEESNLIKLCDEVFGERNFISSICHKSRGSVSNDRIISENHNHILFYAKKIEVLFSHHKEIGEDPDLIGFNYEDEKGKYKLTPVDGPGGAKKGNPFYEFLGIKGYWRYSNETMQQKYDAGLIVKTKNNLQQKYYLEQAEKSRKTVTTWWDEDFLTSSATTDLIKLMGGKYFDNPKNINVLIRCLKMITKFDQNSIILDFFSGSATTAEAVLKFNANDDSKRKFILVQLPEQCGIDTDAYKAGYKTICDIGEDRIRKSGKKIKESSPLTTQDLDIGFRVFKVDSSNMKDILSTPKETQLSLLENADSAIKPDRNPLDLVTQVMLQLGITLDADIKIGKFAGGGFYAVNGNDLVCCFEKNVSESDIEEIARMQPLNVAFRDDSFASDQDEVNCEQIFKTLSPITGKNIFVL